MTTNIQQRIAANDKHLLIERLKKYMINCTIAEPAVQDEFKQLIRSGRRMEFNPKEMIYQEGIKAEYVYYINRGLIKQTIFLPNGKPKIVSINQSGSLFGLEALLNRAYNFHCYSMSYCEITAIPKASFSNLKYESPVCYSRILENLFYALQTNEKWNAEFCTGTIKARVARILCFLIVLNDLEESFPLISGEDMSAMASTTIESVSRILAGFKRSGILTPVTVRNELRYTYDIDKLLLYTTDDKKLLENHETKEEQRQFRRSYISSKADIYIDDEYVDTGVIRDYSQQGVFLDFNHLLEIPNCKQLTIRIRKATHRRLGKVLTGKIIRKTTTGLGVKISETP